MADFTTLNSVLILFKSWFPEEERMVCSYGALCVFACVCLSIHSYILLFEPQISEKKNKPKKPDILIVFLEFINL